MKKTYTIVAYNYRVQMNAVVNYYPLTSKRQAVDLAERMVHTGAKNVEVTCDQTQEVVFKSTEII